MRSGIVSLVYFGGRRGNRVLAPLLRACQHPQAAPVSVAGDRSLAAAAARRQPPHQVVLPPVRSGPSLLLAVSEWSDADTPSVLAIHAQALSAGAEQSDYRSVGENQTVGGRPFGSAEDGSCVARQPPDPSIDPRRAVAPDVAALGRRIV